MENNSLTPQRFRKGSAILLLIIVVAVAFAGYYLSVFLQNPCHFAVKYAVGEIDPRFKISKSEVIDITKDAAERWNRDSGEPVLSYDPDAEMKINLVYDERQERVDAINQAVGSLDSSGNAIESFRERVENEVRQYEQDLTEYNLTVDSWNSRGGAPTEVYANLEKTRISLAERRVEVNRLASLLNQQVDEHNSNLAEMNNRFNADRNKIITEGLYYTLQKKIEIFTFGNREELRLVLMHELGHALSLDHNNLDTAIMYPILGQQDLANPVLTNDDLSLIDNTCHTYQGGLKLLWQRLFQGVAKTLPLS